MPTNNIRTPVYTIYLITNLINNKNYVGKHKLRKNEKLNDRSYMGSGRALKRAEFKYGIENFSKEILAVCYSEEIENILEKEYIKLYKSIGKAEYNETSGGELCDYWNYFSEEKKLKTRQNLSNAGKKTWQRSEYRNKLILAHKGKPSPKKGIKVSEESKRKSSLSHIGKHQSEETKRKISEFNKGKTISNVQKKQISEKNKGRHYYNNGMIEVKEFECPKGFIPGRIHKDRSRTNEQKEHIANTVRGRKHFTNGVIEVFQYECPKGFILGRLNRQKKE